jgi:tRNA1Val (adenine37-N6)-methyltransferase
MENKDERIDDLGVNNLRLIQNKKYFCFGTDSALLANFVESNNSKNVIVDLCSGSGVISLIISAKKKYKKIFAVELQKEMYDLLERNISFNNCSDKIVPVLEDIKNVKSIREKIVDVLSEEKVDIIVCNPPYKTDGTGILSEGEVKYIARHEVKCTLEDVFSTSSKLLNTKGKLYLVHKPERMVDLLCIARKYKLEAKKIRFVYPTIKARPSIVLIEYVRGGGNEMKMLEPLIEYTDDGDYTDEIYEIYGMEKKEKNNVKDN